MLLRQMHAGSLLALANSGVHLRSRLDIHQAVALRQPAGTDALLGWTRSRSLVLWRYSAAAAHRAFATGTEGYVLRCHAHQCALCAVEPPYAHCDAMRISARSAQSNHRTLIRSYMHWTSCSASAEAGLHGTGASR